MTNIPSSDSVTGVHSSSADLGQVELHLEADSQNNQRKKSSSAIADQDTEEIIVKKTSKSCSDVTVNAAGMVMACANIVTGNEVFLSEAANIRKDSKASNCSAEEASALAKALTFKGNLGKRKGEIINMRQIPVSNI